jgi:large subunit ribosomal protein L22e
LLAFFIARRNFLAVMPAKKKSGRTVFHIKCAKPVDDEIFSLPEFNEFLVGKIKVDGRTGSVKEGGPVQVEVDGAKATVSVIATTDSFSKRYLKYLTKKFLKANGLRDYIRVLADSKNSYELRYYTIQDDGDE